MQTKVRSMLEGAMLSGIFLVLLLLTLYTPLGIVTAFTLPVPFTIYATRHDLKESLLVVAVSALLTIMIGALPSVISALFAGLLGVVMGILYRRQKRATAVFIGGTLANLVFFLLSILASTFLFKINPITSIQSMLTQSIQMSESMLSQFGASDPKQVAMLKSMVGLISKMIPMLLILGSAQFALINHWLSRKVLHRLGNQVPAFPPFREWSWPKSVMYYYLTVLAASILLVREPSMDVLQVVLLNIKPILDLLMAIQGLSLVFYYFHRKGYGKGIPIIACVLVFIFPQFPFILILLGILDLGMDIRKRISSKK